MPATPATATGARTSVPALCLGVFLAVWLGLAIAPRYRADWLLENLPTFVAVPLAVATHRRFRFSDRAYVQGTLFLLLHTLGSHYTYSEVPVGDWVRDAFGLARNHYDRLVHFTFGLLLYRPVRELAFQRVPGVGALAERYLTFTAVASWSLLYEVLEWLVAVSVDPQAGTAFLGTQGDVWDAPKDMALACLGALLAACEPFQAGGTSVPPARHARARASAASSQAKRDSSTARPTASA